MQDFHSRLYRAMKDGDDAGVKGLLAQEDAPLNGPAASASPLALMAAVMSERMDYLTWTLEAGADVQLRPV